MILCLKNMANVTWPQDHVFVVLAIFFAFYQFKMFLLLHFCVYKRYKMTPYQSRILWRINLPEITGFMSPLALYSSK